MIEVYGVISEYGGRGRPPTKKRAGAEWLYLQTVKQRDVRGRVQGIKLQGRFGKLSKVLALLGKSTAYVERSNLTSRLFNGQGRKTLTKTRFVRTRACACPLQTVHHASG